MVSGGMVRSMCHAVYRSMVMGWLALGQMRSHRLLSGVSLASESWMVWMLVGASAGQNRSWVLPGSSWSSRSGVVWMRGPWRWILIVLMV